jgi:polyribonucleotide nucleotidyltransferase
MFGNELTTAAVKDQTTELKRQHALSLATAAASAKAIVAAIEQANERQSDRDALHNAAIVDGFNKIQKAIEAQTAIVALISKVLIHFAGPQKPETVSVTFERLSNMSAEFNTSGKMARPNPFAAGWSSQLSALRNP